MSCNAGKITVPDDLRDVLLEFTISYLLEQPGDVIDYAVDFFTRLRDTRQAQLIHEERICISPEEEDEGESRFLVSFASNANRFVNPRPPGGLLWALPAADLGRTNPSVRATDLANRSDHVSRVIPLRLVSPRLKSLPIRFLVPSLDFVFVFGSFDQNATCDKLSAHRLEVKIVLSHSCTHARYRLIPVVLPKIPETRSFACPFSLEI